MQYASLRDLQAAAAQWLREGKVKRHGLSFEEALGTEIAGLKRAETFCWFSDPIHAVEAASASLPTSVRLTADLFEGLAGWWWFLEPLAIPTVKHSDSIVALLWSWGDIQLHPEKTQVTPFLIGTGVHHGLLISAYAYDPQFRSTAAQPTSKVFWKEGQTLESHMREVADRFDNEYQRAIMLDDPEFAFDKESAVLAIERMSRFLIAGALWMKQRILVQSKGHIERHERKRMDRAQVFDRPLTDIQIIQLRRRDVVDATPPDEKGRHVDWKCRWIVSGHWRKRGRYALKPKWINAYDKGPDHLPLKVPTHRVYTVNR
jgi:hypothetical protein